MFGEFLPFDVMVRLDDWWSFVAVISAGCIVCGGGLGFQLFDDLLTLAGLWFQRLLGGSEGWINGSSAIVIRCTAHGLFI